MTSSPGLLQFGTLGPPQAHLDFEWPQPNSLQHPTNYVRCQPESAAQLNCALGNLHSDICVYRSRPLQQGHGRRVVQRRAQGKFGRAEQQGVAAQTARHQVNHRSRCGHGPRLQLQKNGRAHVSVDAAVQSAERDPIRIEYVHETGYADAEATAGLGQCRQRSIVPSVRRGHKILDGRRAPKRVATRPAKQRFLTHNGLEASTSTAVT